MPLDIKVNIANATLRKWKKEINGKHVTAKHLISTT
jgi:hypothetical protein